MELFDHSKQFNVMGARKYTGLVSLLLCLISVVSLIVNGLNFGLEFTGGTQIELRFQNTVTPDSVKQKLEVAGFKDTRVQRYGSSKDILIRLANIAMHDESKISKKLSESLDSSDNAVEVRRVEYVGSEVGEQLAEQGGMAVLMAIFATMVYISLRFEYRFAFSAAAALSHDALIVLGVFSLTQTEFDLAALAAVLAVIGYSLNDTIVVFDRVRENFRKLRKEAATRVMDISISQTMSRTIMTSLLTLLVVVTLLLFGGEGLYGFSLALTVGIIIGTYSSIYVAGALALLLGLSRTDLLSKPKTKIDDLP